MIRDQEIRERSVGANKVFNRYLNKKTFSIVMVVLTF